MTDTPHTKVIYVAVLVSADTRLKDLSHVLDDAFEYHPDILQFAIEGYGRPGDGDPAEGVALGRARRQNGRGCSRIRDESDDVT